MAHGIKRVDVERMLVSKAPAAELAAAALEASDAAGLGRGEADLIVIAIDRGRGNELAEVLKDEIAAGELERFS